MFSLSTSSKSVIKEIDDLLTMKVYFSDDLPGEYANNRRYLQDILEEYAAISKGNIKFEFAPQDKLEEEAQKSGIMPLQLQVIENDKVEVKRVLMGMAIVGIIIIQLIWMNNAINIKQELFDSNVNEALLAVSQQLETAENTKLGNSIYLDSMLSGDTPFEKI